MASYRGHLAFGGATAAAGVAGLSAFTQVKEAEILAPMFLICILGALLPDIDSDSSFPFYLVFGSFTLAVLTAVVYGTLLATQDLTQRIVIPLVALGFLWFVVGRIVKRATVHRGMAHSLPALAIATLSTVLIAIRLEFTPVAALLFGLAIGAGFLSHLVLDEIFSIVDFHGLPFIPNKAFGSALKLWSSSRPVTILNYIVVVFLTHAAFPTIAIALPIIISYVMQG